MGPAIDADFDPATATAMLRTLAGGRERQNYALADIFFAPEELVFRISQDMALEPGDVILCGTLLNLNRRAADEAGGHGGGGDRRPAHAAQRLRLNTYICR